MPSTHRKSGPLIGQYSGRERDYFLFFGHGRMPLPHPLLMLAEVPASASSILLSLALRRERNHFFERSSEASGGWHSVQAAAGPGRK